MPYSFYCSCHGAAGMQALLKCLWDTCIASALPQPPEKQWDQVETRAIAVEGGVCVVAFGLVPIDAGMSAQAMAGRKENSHPVVLQVQDQVQPHPSWR